MSQVVSLDAAKIADMRERKLLTEQSGKVDLPLVSSGEKRLGLLTPEERAVYLQIVDIDTQLEDWGHEIAARSAELVAKHIRSSPDPTTAHENISADSPLESDAEGEEYYELIYRKEYLQAMFWYTVRARLASFGHTLGIRIGFTIVSTGKKYSVAK